MRIIVIGLILMISLLGCEDSTECCSINFDTQINIKFLNDQGENLFEMNEGYQIANMSVYHYSDGAWKRYFGGSADAPKGISLVTIDNETYLTILPSTNEVNANVSETKLQFTDDDFYILKTEVDNRNGSIVNKVWFNDVLMWESGQGERMFEVIK